MRIVLIVGVLAVAGAGVVTGVATGSDTHPSRTRAVTRTVTVTRTVLATTTQPGVSVFVSSNGENAGKYVAHPSSINLIPAPPDNAEPGLTKAVHLHWIDWGQPIAFATGAILVKSYGSTGFQAFSGLLAFYNIMACGTGPTNYYTTAFTLPRFLTYYEDGQVSLASPCG